MLIGPPKFVIWSGKGLLTLFLYPLSAPRQDYIYNVFNKKDVPILNALGRIFKPSHLQPMPGF